MALSFGLSFVRFDEDANPSRMTWVGAEHYRRALGVDGAASPREDNPWYWRALGGRPRDPLAYQALYNGLTYALPAVPLGLCTSLFVALLLNQPLRGAPMFRALIYLPHVLGGVAGIVIWSWLLNPQFGWINQCIRWVYAMLDPVVRLIDDTGTAAWAVPDWLYSPTACRPALVIMHVWTMGAAMLIFLAALRRVPTAYYEAAHLDGAGPWHRFHHVTLPQITPALLFNLTVGLIFTMQAFSEPYLLQNRRQDDGLLFPALYIYRVAFESPFQLGYASALAWIFFAVTLLIVAPVLWTSRRWVHYADDANGSSR